MKASPRGLFTVLRANRERVGARDSSTHYVAELHNNDCSTPEEQS